MSEFEYTRVAAFEGGQLFGMEGDTLLMGHFENVNKPEGAPLGYHAALCRMEGGEYVVVASGNKYYEQEWSSGGPAETLAPSDIEKFNIWLAEAYGDEPASLFLNFIGDMHDIFKRHTIVDGQLVESV